MTTITKERAEIKSFITGFLSDPAHDNQSSDSLLANVFRIALASLEADPVKRVNSDQMRRVCLEANRHLDKYDAMAKEVNKLLGRIAPPAPVVPEEATPENVEMLSGYVSTYKLTDSERDIAAEIWNACRAAMLHAGNFRENKNSSTNNFREIAETSTNYPVIPSEVLSAILKVARVRADFDDFDGDRRGIGDCLDEAEQELIVTINKYASQLAAEPIATNDVREQTAVPPVPEIQADVAQAIENLKQKLVECNRYNYCADAVKGVEDASRVLALQNQNMSAPITPEAIENAIEYIRSIAFHIDEDDYHGKHIAYFMRQALALLEGHSCSNDRLGKADNQPVRGNQAAESNRGNEWTGNPDIDNAIIMLDRIDTLENCDDDRIEAVKAVLRRLAGNYPDIPDSSVPAPGKGVTGERIRIKPHVYRELVNRLHDTAIKSAGTQQLRERISRVLGDVITPDHHKQAEKSGLERCHLEAALNIKPGHTLGIIDALLVHRMAKALLPLVAEKHEADHANES
ncbi:dTDP-6-deoxy-L-hexose 3-O-methyltransferase [Escherichia coli]|nr:dTDP-6-deoxy-L-hexose 3-O-methyltransferase [Escherichia coli]EFM1778732.1 dTDP-6-deoxy-L-hexose 3-O-methyltransferase [Escherichia coli]EGB1107735.1 dTDP-6-deoxy-L-hexose 3-O-methyltransferase [Escherichia coli]EGF8515571.1 dTDP-6-deoxy-L-hexose 3-O-methyltransferase [Escherichia coli]EHD6296044.1 dTDP-6-deoxy-L-hexose 3-O-methyltransferase [Escherichia coli]